jgi:hypothetical protein
MLSEMATSRATRLDISASQIITLCMKCLYTNYMKFIGVCQEQVGGKTTVETAVKIAEFYYWRKSIEKIGKPSGHLTVHIFTHLAAARAERLEMTPRRRR